MGVTRRERGRRMPKGRTIASALSLLLALSYGARGRGQSSVPGERPQAPNERGRSSDAALPAPGTAPKDELARASKRERPSGRDRAHAPGAGPDRRGPAQHERAEPAAHALPRTRTGPPSKSRWSVCIARSPRSRSVGKLPEQMATLENCGEILRELRAQCRGRPAPSAHAEPARPAARSCPTSVCTSRRCTGVREAACASSPPAARPSAVAALAQAELLRGQGAAQLILAFFARRVRKVRPHSASRRWRAVSPSPALPR